MPASDIIAALPTWFLLVLLGLLGAIWGSFIAALCSRWPNGETISTGRSLCDHCGTDIAAYDLVPVMSFLLLKGKCRACGQKIGALPLFVEVVAIFVATVPVLILPPLEAIAAAIFGWLLLPLVILDWRHLWLPDRLILILCAIGVFAGPALAPSATWLDRVIGLICGFASLELIRRGFKYLRGYDGMGAGDPKLFGALGIWLGWQALPMILLGASAIGLISVLVERTVAKKTTSFLPLGSFLGVAAYLLAILGQ